MDCDQWEQNIPHGQVFETVIKTSNHKRDANEDGPTERNLDTNKCNFLLGLLAQYLFLYA